MKVSVRSSTPVSHPTCTRLGFSLWPSPGGGVGSTRGCSTSVETAKTTIGRDKPFAVKDHAGTVARPLLVSTSAVFNAAPVIVSLHFDTGTAMWPQLSYGVPIA